MQILILYCTVTYAEIPTLLNFFWLWDNMEKLSIIHLSGWGKGVIYLAQKIIFL